MTPIERLEALLARVQNNAASLASARARGEWKDDGKYARSNGHAAVAPAAVAPAAVAPAAVAPAAVAPADAGPAVAELEAAVESTPALAPAVSPRVPAEAAEAQPSARLGESGELLAIEAPALGEAELEAELAASETSGTWREGAPPTSGPSWPAPANDAQSEATAESAGASWEPPPSTRGEAISGSWAHEQPPAPDWQDATPEPAATTDAWQETAEVAQVADAELEDAELEYEERAPRTPPPESGPQVSPPSKLGLPEIDVEGPISVGGEQIAVEQLGATVELEPATSGSLEMDVAGRDTPRVPADDFEEPLPRADSGAVYDESLAPPPNATDELAAMDRARLEKAARLSTLPEGAMTVAADTIAVPPPTPELETGILVRSPIPTGIVAATFEGQRRATAHTFLELLDDSLGLGR